MASSMLYVTMINTTMVDGYVFLVVTWTVKASRRSDQEPMLQSRRGSYQDKVYLC